MELEKLLAFKDDEEFLNDLVKIKREKKEALVAHIKEHEGEELNPDSIFDIQIKRLQD